MNAYNPLESARRLEATGLARAQAEAIAMEIRDSTDEFVTRPMLRDELDAALAKQTVRVGGMTAGIVAVATAILGLLISIK